jgi:hypothetical protein
MARRRDEEFLLVPKEIEARREARRALASLPRGVPSELKYYTLATSTGVLSQNTWSGLVSGTSGVWSGIVQGTDQNQRLGRRINVRRLRVVISPSALAYDTRLAAFTVLRTDSNIAASDLFSSSGFTRSQFDYPNPVGQDAVYAHTMGTAMQLAGAAAGTTPSYASVVAVHDVRFGKGLQISYDVSGATGPLPITYVNVSETAITMDYFIQIWFEDA